MEQQQTYPAGAQTNAPGPLPLAYWDTRPDNECGHQDRASIRYVHQNHWISLCLDCWQRQRQYDPTPNPDPGSPSPDLNSNKVWMRNTLDRVTSHRQRQPTQRPHRIMLYSHDTYGLGHLRRNLAIARQLLGSPGRFEVLLITGSPMQSSWPLPPELTVRSLPPVIKLGDEHYGPRDHAKNFALLKGHREALILEATLSFRPDVFLVDHAPIGMGGELLPTLALLQEEYPQTRRVLGLRDIIDDPQATQKVWKEQNIPDILERVYDAILVYGRKDWFDVISAYDIPSSVAAKIHFCGYVCNKNADGTPYPNLPHSLPGYPRILVTVGGGGDGRRIIEGYLTALRRHDGFGCQSLIVPGPLMDPADRAELEASLADLPDVHLIDGATDMLPLMRQCDLVISMAGYNTSAEILSLGCKAILVPRARPRAEQRLRAGMLARLGLVEQVDPDGDIAEQLGYLVPIALSGEHPLRNGLYLDGAKGVVAELHALATLSGAEVIS